MAAMIKGKLRTRAAIIIATSLLMLTAFALAQRSSRDTDATAVAMADESDGDQNATHLAATMHPVFINQPSGPPRIDTGMLDDLGRPISVSCASCHTNTEPNVATRSGHDLLEFHQGLHVDHGGMSCLTCHSANNYNMLRLADGSELPYQHVQDMCAQCHAPQHRDFLRGAHGGMTGYWDRTRGPQTRKNCIDCHDPHAPAFPHMVPTFKPRDRFLDPPHAHE